MNWKKPLWKTKIFRYKKEKSGEKIKLPVIGWVDKLGDTVLGAAQYGIVLFAIGWVLRMFGFMTLHELGQGSILFSRFF